MNKVFWFFQVLLFLAFGLFGVQKVLVPIPDLIEQGMLWIADFPVWQVRLIGALEALGALGLILPYVVKAIPRILVSAASAGLAVTMIGAVITHVLRQDPTPSIVITTLLFGMCVAVTWKRFTEIK